MAYQKLEVRIEGIVPLLMHNGQLADPLNRWAKEMKRISGKRSKTDADFEELARLEWYGSLYLKDGQPCLPGMNVEKVLIEAARKRRQGKLAEAGIFVDADAPLIYDGPKDLDELWNDERYRLTAGVRIQRNKVMRTRPKFDEWAADILIEFDDEQLNEQDVLELLTVAGRTVGLGDWRPKYGRFVIKE